MSAQQILSFLRLHRFAVQASVARDQPQAAVVGFAVTDAFELVFDTLETARKTLNLRRNQNIAFVIGGMVPGDERTVQYEGLADEPTGADLERVKAAYYSVFADGRVRGHQPGLTYFRVRPAWLRYSDYNQKPPMIQELRFHS